MRLPLLPLLLASLPAMAALQNENLVENLPAGYKIDFQTEKDDLVMTEMVPAAQSVHRWDEMLTTQVFLGMHTTTPQDFRDVMVRQWQFSCPGSDYDVLADGRDNGYPFALWYLSCPNNPATGQPELTWFKAIQGHDSFYVIQKAFKFSPSKAQQSEWLQYLRSVQLCDSRLADSACPALD
ncbi:hypothetical protein [Vogesella sp. LIG4]|uniref:hypothetical protein n=1 Tax=Vogesella sp. LIG4 TaxID=1192162 RepID=UPI00081FA329|nr:hypothetical protein [Vogesella sp. LIG4]SCK13745.1 hypothetical protein PSELUDRAFT_1288 [Vogesella sp. LIG4]